MIVVKETNAIPACGRGHVHSQTQFQAFSIIITTILFIIVSARSYLFSEVDRIGRYSCRYHTEALSQ